MDDADKLELARERLERPDGVIYRSDTVIDEFVKPFTVSIISPHPRREDGRPHENRWIGSGFLVQLWERYFILTAGHVVRDVQRLRGAAVNLVIAAAIHDARFLLEPRNFICSDDPGDDADFGYFELHAVDARRVLADDKVIAHRRRVEVCTVENDLYAICGFPRHRVIDAIPGQTFVGHHRLTTAAAGFRSIPTAPAARPGIQVLSVSIDDSEIVLDRSADGESITLKDAVESLSGTSGGPCWRMHAPSAEGEAWTPESMKVVAIHRGTDPSAYRFAREVSVGHHLKLIAEDYTELHDRIMHEWPLVQNYPATTTFRVP